MSHRRRTSHVEVPLVAAAAGLGSTAAASPAASAEGLLAPYGASSSPGTSRSRSPLAAAHFVSTGGAGADHLEHISAVTTATDSASVSLLKHATTASAAATAEAKPTTASTYAKALSLVTLTVQNSAMVLILRYSRTLSGPPYLTTTAVLLCEVFKLMLSVTLYMTTSAAPLFVTMRKLPRQVFSSGWYLLSVPAILYTVQNNLQYEAVTRLDAATFAVTYQLKILTTALCSVLILRRSLSWTKWMALVILTAGVALVQMPTTSTTSAAHSTTHHAPIEAAAAAAAADSASHHAPPAVRSISGATSSSDPLDAQSSTVSAAATLASAQALATHARLLGLACVILACLISGLAGVYFEKILKGSTTSLWIRNVQLSLFSLVPALFGVAVLDGAKVAQAGFFQGYTVWTWVAILFQTLGGLIVSLVVKYADNILKGFATSVSIILSSVASVYLFGFEPSGLFVVGASLVILASYLYGRPEPPPGPRRGSLPLPRHSKPSRSSSMVFGRPLSG